jgi:hypothetical protein
LKTLPENFDPKTLVKDPSVVSAALVTPLKPYITMANKNKLGLTWQDSVGF